MVTNGARHREISRAHTSHLPSNSIRIPIYEPRTANMATTRYLEATI